MATMQATRISLEVGSDEQACRDFAAPLYLQLNSGAYDECAVLEIPETIDDWLGDHRTARKRASHCRRLGYTGHLILNRGEHAADVYEINTSLEERQGRPMSAAYSQRPLFSDPVYDCERHGVHSYGVTSAAGRLVAYLWMYRVGDLALVSSILGHADHLRNDIMYELFQTALEGEIGNGPGYVVYNRFDSGSEGLRYFKSKLGFTPQQVEWAP